MKSFNHAKNNVVIGGLTASGKTTHTRLSQQVFGLSVCSASTILCEQAGFDGELPADFWVTQDGQLLVSRILDLGIDEILMEKENSLSRTIFDCRSLPWLSDEPLSIWLKSSEESRTWKSIVSHGKEGLVDFDKTKNDIAKKDNEDRENLLKGYGFDIFTDYWVADIVLDISMFIAAPTKKASRKSVDDVQCIVSNLLGCYLYESDFFKNQYKVLLKECGNNVFCQVSERFNQLIVKQ